MRRLILCSVLSLASCKEREEPQVIAIPDPPRPTIEAKPVAWSIGPDGATPVAWVLRRTK